MGFERALRDTREAWLAEEVLPVERSAQLEVLVRRRGRQVRLKRSALAAAAVAAVVSGVAFGPALAGFAAGLPGVGPFVERVLRLTISKGTPYWVSGGPVIGLATPGQRTDYGSDLWFDYHGSTVDDGRTVVTVGIHGSERAVQRVQEDFAEWVIVDTAGQNHQANVRVDADRAVLTAWALEVEEPLRLKAGVHSVVANRDQILELRFPAGVVLRRFRDGGPVVDMRAQGQRSTWGDLWFEYNGRSLRDDYTVFSLHIPADARTAQRIVQDFDDWVVLGEDGRVYPATVTVDGAQPGRMTVRVDGDVVPVRLRARRYLVALVPPPTDVGQPVRKR